MPRFKNPVPASRASLASPRGAVRVPVEPPPPSSSSPFNSEDEEGPFTPRAASRPPARRSILTAVRASAPQGVGYSSSSDSDYIPSAAPTRASGSGGRARRRVTVAADSDDDIVEAGNDWESDGSSSDGVVALLSTSDEEVNVRPQSAPRRRDRPRKVSSGVPVPPPKPIPIAKLIVPQYSDGLILLAKWALPTFGTMLTDVAPIKAAGRAARKATFTPDQLDEHIGAQGIADVDLPLAFVVPRFGQAQVELYVKAEGWKHGEVASVLGCSLEWSASLARLTGLSAVVPRIQVSKGADTPTFCLYLAPNALKRSVDEITALEFPPKKNPTKDLSRLLDNPRVICGCEIEGFANDAFNTLDCGVRTRIVTDAAVPTVLRAEEAETLASLAASRGVHLPEAAVQAWQRHPLRPEDLYSPACSPATYPMHEEPPESEFLLPTLRSYQRKGVSWWRHRESVIQDTILKKQEAQLRWPLHGRHALFASCLAADGTSLFISVPLGAMIPESGAIIAAEHLEAPLSGGIFADEMGLGKTVCTLAVVSGTNKEVAVECARQLDPLAASASDLGGRISTVMDTVRPLPTDLPEVPTSALDSTPSDDVACICGCPYLVPLDAEVSMGVALLRRSGVESALVRGRERADDLPWVRCGICSRWQHAVCSGTLYAKNGNIVCTECEIAALGGYRVLSSSNLVICTPSLRDQWISEINRHVLAHFPCCEVGGHCTNHGESCPGPVGLRVVVYDGVKATLAIMRNLISELVSRRRKQTSQMLRAGTKRRRPEFSEFSASDSDLEVEAPAKRSRTAGDRRSRAVSAKGETPLSQQIAQLEKQIHHHAQTLSAAYLGSADVVLTTYTAIAEDIYHADNETAELVDFARRCSTTFRRSEDIEEWVLNTLVPAARAPGKIGRCTISEVASSLDAALARNKTVDRLAVSTTRALRHAKKYRVVVSPMLHVRFYRACLDEAQEIDTPTAKAAEMARRIPTVHRWCISGTPFKKSPYDFHGLLVFLGWFPYFNKEIFERLVLARAEAGSSSARRALMELAGLALWRTKKSDVLDELDLPPLLCEVVRLSTTRIEKAFYRRTFGQCAERIAPLLSTWRSIAANADNGLVLDQPLDLSEQNALLAPLLRLRQSIVHPQLASKTLIRKTQAPGEKKKNNVSSLTDVLESMLTQARVDCEDELRTVVWSLNGQAGLYWGLGQLDEAEKTYRKGATLVSESEGPGNGGIRVDKLQKVHLFRNLALLLQNTTTGALEASATRQAHIAELNQRATAIEKEYLFSAGTRVQEKFQKLFESTRQLHRHALREDLMAADPAPPSFQLGTGVGEASLAKISEILEKNAEIEKTVLLTVKPLMDSAQSVKGDESFRTFEQDLLNACESSPSVGAQEIQANPLLKGTLSTAVIWDLGTKREVKGEMLKAILYTAISKLFSARQKALDDLRACLSPTGSDLEVASQCGSCRADWGRKGPTCIACRAKMSLRNYNEQLASFKSRQLADAEIKEAGELSNAGRAKRRNRKSVLAGLEGNLDSFLKATEGDTNVPEGEPGFADLLAQEKDNFRVPTAMMRCLGELCSIGRLVASKPDADAQARSLREDAESLSQLLTAISNEMKFITEVHTEQQQLLLALDELQSCVTRTEVVPTEVEIKEAEKAFKIHRSAVNDQLYNLKQDEEHARREFLRARGQLQYLLNIKEEERAAGSTVSRTSDCPICLSELQNRVAIMPTCAHRFCATHLRNLMERGAVKCPVCRAICDESELHIAVFHGGNPATPASEPGPISALAVDPLARSLIRSASQESTGEEAPSSGDPSLLRRWFEPQSSVRPGAASVLVDGSFGTKIEGLVRCILRLSNAAAVDGASSVSDPSKCLVFSEWDDALHICQEAFNRNHVPCMRMESTRDASKLVEAFAGDPSVAVLLLPLKSGAEGLNITCANHVFFLEPLLTPALKAQAIGRVHRIGQSRRTYVHDLVVADTIEETIIRLANQRSHTGASSWGAIEISRFHKTQKHGIGDHRDAAELRKREVLEIFQSDADFEQHLLALGKRAAGSSFAAQPTPAAIEPSKPEASEPFEPEHKAEAVSAAQVPAVLAAQLRMNNQYWTARVIYKGQSTIRLAVLNDLRPNPLPEHECLDHYGRRVPKDIASALDNLVTAR